MALRALLPLVSIVFFVSSCGGGGGEDCPDPDTHLANGCPSYVCEGQALGDETDTYESFATGFFEGYCTRCHATSRTMLSGCAPSDPTCRNGAPLAHDWDDPASIRRHLDDIRLLSGVLNEMPVSAPFPSCEERRRIVSWIDRGAPGLP